jgi:hypothetical protein
MQAGPGGEDAAPLVKLGSLWIGGNLSWLEQLCLKSFLDHGHEVTLYTYEGVTNAPEGTVVADARPMFPATTSSPTAPAAPPRCIPMPSATG